MSGRRVAKPLWKPAIDPYLEFREAEPTLKVLEALGYQISRVSRLRMLANGRCVRRICYTKRTDGARLVVRFAVTMLPTEAP